MMIALFCLLLTLIASPLKSKSRPEAENAALRHQLIILRRMVRGRVTGSEAFALTRFLEDYITITSGFRFSVHTGAFLHHFVGNAARDPRRAAHGNRCFDAYMRVTDIQG